MLEIIDHLENLSYVTYQQFSKDTGCTFKDVVTICESETGCIHKRNNRHLIMYNDDPEIILQRKIFTLAHEIGHLQLGHTSNEIYLIAENIHDPNSIYEKRANYFASLLLAPTPILYKLKFNNHEEIQKYFFLSKMAAEVAFSRYKNYDRNYNIQWHNRVLKAFS